MSARRVVLLARAGSARERTEAALKEVGAELVATFDPAEVSETVIRSSEPDILLVLLDPAVEQALEGFGSLLADSSLDVMFEDADVAARREGWEAARWARHLAAKLHGHDNVLPGQPGTAATSVFGADMEQLRRDVAAMPDVPPAAAVEKPAGCGAVVIVAGVGGPDAVRQLLSGLPHDFKRSVLLRQRIEGGQYDKLVRQMGRVTQLPVVLAQAGDPVAPARVYVLPEGIDVHANRGELAFIATDGEATFAALRAPDSAMLLLSGADPALVDAAMAMRWAGGLVAGQSAENCFDPAASDALVARGGEAFDLSRISQLLLERWPA